MLDLVADDNLKRMGVAREIVNRVQKLRKEAGLNIDDHVEIFYEVPSGETVFHQVVDQNLQSMQSAIKVPFIDGKFR